MASIPEDVAAAIGQQVEQMIRQAKKDSEVRVKHDLSVARSHLQHMESLVDGLVDRVAQCARANGTGALDPPQTVDRAFLTQTIAQLEKKWGSEVKALKSDMHRTILAHNHNSDLMRHHRDALDEAKKKLDAQMQPKAEQVDAQIEKVDRMLRAGQAKQRALDALTDQLTTLELQLNELLPPNLGAAGLPGGGLNLMQGLLGGGSAASLAQREAAVAAATAKRAPKKDGELPTEEEVRSRLLQNKCSMPPSELPTEEEVRARMLQHTRGLAAPVPATASATDEAGVAFNVQAPCFIPHGATSPSEANDSGAKPAPGGGQPEPADNDEEDTGTQQSDGDGVHTSD